MESILRTDLKKGFVPKGPVGTLPRSGKNPTRPDQGTAKAPGLSWGEYLGSIGPIPLEGPIGYVYGHLKKGGASSLDAMTITKGLIITGLGATGMHVQEEASACADTRQHKIEQYRPSAGR